MSAVGCNEQPAEDHGAELGANRLLADLHDALADLAARRGETEILGALAERVVAITPGAGHAGVLLGRARRPLARAAATSAAAADCDETQRTPGSPASTAVETAAPAVAEFTEIQMRWPELATALHQHRLGGVAAVPLVGTRGAFGALTVYTSVPPGGEVLPLATVLAHEASVAVSHAQTHEHLREALESRQEIGQAIGILMERHRVTADEAFARLVFVSQRTHRKIRELAAWLIHTGEEPRILLPAARKER
jgi:hypothetical protein